MAETFYSILTSIGKAKIANAAGLGTKIDFVKMKVGDGNGSYYNPTESQTDLVHTVWQGNINQVAIDEDNPNWINIEVLIPPSDGGFFIREYGVFDSDGNMLAIAKCAETYKPLPSDGGTKEITMKMVLAISNTSSVTLKIDPTVIFAKKSEVEIVQNQVNSIKSEVENARGTYENLEARLDHGDTQLSDKANKTDGGLDRLNATSKFATILPSYIALVNYAYTDDNGTRFYICPKAEVTTGTGGAIKIFADPYHLGGSDYRDFGLYFSSDQNGDTGANGTGVNWINVKTNGKHYQKYPDIAFGFQDGIVVPGRFVAFANGSTGLVIGKNTDKFIRQYTTFGIELQKHMVFRKDQAIYFEGGDGNATNKIVFNTTTGQFEISSGGTVLFAISPSKVQPLKAFSENDVDISNNSTTVNAREGNKFIFSNTIATTITDFINGERGQEITIILNDTVTTIQNNSNIKLKGGVDFRPTNLLSNITLVRLGDKWIETTRTEF